MNQFPKKIFLACIFTNILEWYDFAIYASLSPIISKLFFATHDTFFNYILTFTIFAAGFIIRPLGGIILGFIADKYGRAKVYSLSLFLMAIPAFCTGFLPTYNQIGYIAPFLLLSFRVLQGFAMGGEYPLIVTYLAEVSKPKNRGLNLSIISASLTFGLLLANLLVLVLNKTLGNDNMLAYGWRIPFVISFFMIIMSYFIRKNLPESFLFKSRTNYKFDFTLFKQYKLRITNTFIYTIGIAIGFYLLSVFTTTYLNIDDKVSYQTSLYLSNLGIILLIICNPIMGKLSDVIGRKRFAIISNSCLIIFALPIYWLINSTSFFNIILAQILFSALIASILGPLPATLAEQFPTSTRATSIAISYNMCVTIFGGTSPIISLLLIKFLHTNLAPGIYLASACFISLLATRYIKDKHHEILD